MKKLVFWLGLSIIGLLVIIEGFKIGRKTFEPILPPSPFTIIKGRLKPGEDLFSSLKRNRLSSELAYKLIQALKGKLNFRKLTPRDTYKVIFKENAFYKFVYFSFPQKLLGVISKGDTQEFLVYQKIVPLKRTPQLFSIKITRSLYEAVVRHRYPISLIPKIVALFGWDIDFYYDVRPGDQIKLMIERITTRGNKFVRWGPILAAQYIGNLRTYTAIFFEGSHYTETGKAVARQFLKSPLKYRAHISSRFSYRRKHPILGGIRPHWGVDYAAPKGTPVVATASGRVKFSGWKGGYGKLIILRHSNGYETRYGHLSRIFVKRGQKVRQGQVIGRVGTSGLSTGYHLHYEVRLRGRALNPLKIKRGRGKPLPKQKIASFNEIKKERLSILKNLDS
jgi:murein DD-endopeptidase MepM/ murein hydrolase activator NlpD